MNRAGNDDWQHCNPAVIKEMVANSHRESRRAMLKRIGLSSAGLFTVVAGTTFWWANRKPTREEMRNRLVIPITCGDVRTNLVHYHASTLEDDALNRRIKCHLKHCRSCRKFYTSRFENASV